MIRGIIRSLKELLFSGSGSGGTIYLISDLHLNHARILRHCHRPFSSLRHMNSDLVERWNRVVGPGDTVYHLGDFSIRGSPRQWIHMLNGRKVFIRGNHDGNLLRAKRHSTLSYGGYEFYLVHDPHDVPASWKGWVIHGHTHNKISRYPFINGETRTINVSCECTGYAPVSIDHLVSLNLRDIFRMETVHSRPIRKSHMLLEGPPSSSL
ncbi:MAG: metallophosphoesterase [Methanolinea sp.]|jgi:calcineurin-like phosphoesterase family protein|nr:metallophosphoesterase [Methanolinea sp.]